MKALSISVKNLQLRRYIKYFLFLENKDPFYRKNHTSFPNTNHCLGLLKNSKMTQIGVDNFQISNSSAYNSYLTGIYKTPISIEYQGEFQEICIDFEPLGLESLFREKLSDYIFLNNILEALGPHYRSLYDLAFKYTNPEEAAKELECYFIKLIPDQQKTKNIPFNDFYFHRVEDLSSVYGMSLRSINRLFKNSFNLTPKEFLKILRLRRSIEFIKNGHSQITSAHMAGFSDQSHFIREFKKFSNKTPKKFFKDCIAVDNQVWIDFDQH